MAMQVVDTRNQALEIPSLGMRCTERELVQPLGARDATLWIGLCRLMVRETPGEDGDWRMMTDLDPVSIAVAGTQFLAVAAPKAPMRPAVWVSVPISDLDVEAQAVGGLFRKRPRGVSIESRSDDWMMAVAEVGRHWPSTNRYQAGQAESLLKALMGA